MSNLLTEWFSPEIKPAYPGVYNASSFKDNKIKRYWNGKNWSCPFMKNDTEKDKIYFRSRPAIFQIDKWRGLQVNVCPQ